MITTLISQRDNVEIITDQIGMILTNELQNQRRLATAAGQDPALWTLNTYTERSDIWEQVLNSSADRNPIVNVWFDTGSYNQTNSNISERQQLDATYNLDIYGLGISRDLSVGHVAGDEDAAREVMRGVRLVRNILMAANNTYLQMQGVVWQRWVSNVSKFQPQLDDRSLQHVHGARLSLMVKMNEFSPQAQPERLEQVALDVFRREDGRLVAEADYDYGSM